MFRRTSDPQRPVSTCASNYLDLLLSDNFAADEAITLLIEGTPLPELIESLQELQFFFGVANRGVPNPNTTTAKRQHVSTRSTQRRSALRDNRRACYRILSDSTIMRRPDSH